MTARLIQLNRQLNSPLNVTQLSPLHRDYFSPFWEKASKWPFTLITSRCAEVLISSSSKLAFPSTFPPRVVNSVQEEPTVHIAHSMGVLLVTIETHSYHGSPPRRNCYFVTCSYHGSPPRHNCYSLISWEPFLITIETRSYHGSHKKVSLPDTIETLTFPHISSSTLGREGLWENKKVRKQF